MDEKRLARRDFLKLAVGGFAVAVVGPSLVRKGMGSPEPEEESKHSWAMVIDQSKCVGCDHCVLACKAHNDVSPDMAWSRIVETGEKGNKETFMPIACMQCADAPCAHICPVGATYQRSDGIVMMDYDRCIGCRYCEMACPYDARAFNWEEFSGENPAVPTWGQPEVARRPRGVVEKCSFCFHRIDRGLEQGLMPGVDQAATPACVVACPTGARVFGDLNDPDSPASKTLTEHWSFRLREDLGTEPRIYYLPVYEATEEEKVA